LGLDLFLITVHTYTSYPTLQTAYSFQGYARCQGPLRSFIVHARYPRAAGTVLQNSFKLHTTGRAIGVLPSHVWSVRAQSEKQLSPCSYFSLPLWLFVLTLLYTLPWTYTTSKRLSNSNISTWRPQLVSIWASVQAYPAPHQAGWPVISHLRLEVSRRHYLGISLAKRLC
jgi:hypothetical protein